MRTLYIVDDDETYARVVTEPLKSSYVVKICPDAENCVQAVKVKVPDIVIIDYYLPGMNGLELFKILQEDFQIPKLILLSANEDSKVVLDMIRNGVRDYVIKDEHVMDSLKEALEDAPF